MERELKSRIRRPDLYSKIISPQEAAALIKDGMHIGTSGFTPCGYPKAIPLAVADRVRKGEKLKLTLGTGASVGRELDETWATCGIIRRRYPYQTGKNINSLINEGKIDFTDIHLSQVARALRAGILGRMDFAIVEGVAITEEGGIVPSTSVGNAHVFVAEARRVMVEVNISQPPEMEGIHDIYPPSDALLRDPIPIKRGDERIGLPYIPCSPEKIMAIVPSSIPDEARDLGTPNETTKAIARNLAEFLIREFGEDLPPLQSGVGSLANAVLRGLLNGPWYCFSIWSEVIQDAVLDMIDAGRVSFATGTSISPSPERLKIFYQNLNRYRQKLILRPVEITNNPEIIRRLNLISMNTVLEVDIYGNANSTQLFGTRMLNGIGGSGDFSRNAGLVIMMTPSIAQEGRVSCIVPHVAHIDHTEHELHVLVTELGIADLRGKTPRERAQVIIENCAHPDYRDLLRDYFKRAIKTNTGHTPILLKEAFGWHIRYLEKGSMKP